MVIVIVGVAGAGKTTIGQSLAVELGWRFVEGDNLHPRANVEKMRAGVPLTDADRQRWLAALHAIIARALERREHTVVACSGLKERYRETLRGNLRTVRFVYLRASPEVVRHRLADRREHFFNPALLDDQFQTLEEPADALTLEATCPPEAILSAIRDEFGV